MKEVLKSRIKKFLNKKAEMIQKYANKKSKMIQNHKNKKSKMIQNHQNALINAANHISAAKRKINKFEQMQLESVGPKSSLEPIWSPNIGKRPHRKSSKQQVMPIKRGKKRGQAAMRHNMGM